MSFPSINSFNPHNNSNKQFPLLSHYLHIAEMIKEAQRHYTNCSQTLRFKEFWSQNMYVYVIIIYMSVYGHFIYYIYM